MPNLCKNDWCIRISLLPFYHSEMHCALPLEHLDEGDPKAFGEAAVDQEVDGRVQDEEEVVHITCGVLWLTEHPIRKSYTSAGFRTFVSFPRDIGVILSKRLKMRGLGGEAI